MKYFLVLIFVLQHFIFFGQNQYNIDSINKVLRATTNDTVKIKMLQRIFDNYLYKKPDSAKIAFEEMQGISQNKGFYWGYYQTYLYKSTYFWTIGKIDSVVTSLNLALEYARDMKDDTKISYCYIRLAMAQSTLGNYSEAKKLTLNALNIAKKNNDWEGLYYAYYQLGNTFYYENNFDEALINYLKVDSIFQHHERKEPALAASLSNIGSIFMEFKNFDKAVSYFNQSKKLYREMKREEGQVYIDFNLGKVEFNKGNHNKAITILLPVLEYYNKVESKNYLSDISGWIGASYLKTQEIKKAELYYRNSAKWALEVKNKLLEANAHIGLAEVAQLEQKPDEAIFSLTKAQLLYEEMGISYNGAQILKNLAAAYSSKKNYKQAYNFSQQYQSLIDSLTKKENAKIFQDLETKYQTEKKEQKIVLLTSQNELVEQQKKNQRNLLLAGLGLTSLTGLFFFFLYRNRQKINKKLKEIDNLKSNFFANISHEFRTPLTLISAPLEKKLDSDRLSKNDREDFEMMQRNSSRLLNLVDQLLDLSKLESGNLKLNVSQGDLSSLLKSITSSFQHLAKQKSITYSVNIDHFKHVWYDKNVIEKTVINLLSNAFKYTPESGFVNFIATIKADELEIHVENNGSMLSKDNIEQLFNRFYQVDSTTEGVGIGLSLVKELVTLSHGTIQVENTKDSTILFKVVLPIAETKFAKNELVTEVGRDSASVDYNQPSFIISKDEKEDGEIMIDENLPILLIVEDNADVRDYISKTFAPMYQIIEAKDGKMGIEKALEFVPDIIISDIMMPETDGFELCKTLKLDERTSHIPIILLTAKVGEEDQYKGLETGADAYITKPFKIKLLETRVQNLILSRKSLRERYSQEVVLKPKDIAITSLDELFLEKVQNVLDKKLTESSFSVEEFSKAVGMSRMQLHRKLRALTDLSASEFIRSQRLKLAASLLQQSDANISEIGYTSGFNDHAYFSKCFKEAYGCSPSEYIAK
tara:strand:- start:9443 stop:12400 length:2958 start_codon:yes stop_codon:yes gene_type:complete